MIFFFYAVRGSSGTAGEYKWPLVKPKPKIEPWKYFNDMYCFDVWQGTDVFAEPRKILIWFLTSSHPASLFIWMLLNLQTKKAIAQTAAIDHKSQPALKHDEWLKTDSKLSKSQIFPHHASCHENTVFFSCSLIRKYHPFIPPPSLPFLKELCSQPFTLRT